MRALPVAIVIVAVLAGACVGGDPVDDGLRDLYSATAAVGDAVERGESADQTLAEAERTWAAVADDVAADRPLVHLEIDEALAALGDAVEDDDAAGARRAALEVAVEIDHFLGGG